MICLTTAVVTVFYTGPTVAPFALQWRAVFKQPWGWGRWPEVLFGSASPSLRATLWERVKRQKKDGKTKREKEMQTWLGKKRISSELWRATTKGFSCTHWILPLLTLTGRTKKMLHEHYQYRSIQDIYRLYLLGLHSSWLLALRGASRWAGNTRWPGSQCLVHFSQHHLWDELAVLCLVVTNQLHRWTHNLDKYFYWQGYTLKFEWPRLDNKAKRDKQRGLNNTVVNASWVGRALWCHFNWNLFCMIENGSRIGLDLMDTVRKLLFFKNGNIHSKL